MTTRAKDVFMTFREFADWMKELTEELSLEVLLDRGPKEQLQQWRGDDRDLAGCSQVFFTANASASRQIRSNEVNAAKLGWVGASVPRSIGDSLYLCRLGARSDWWDPIECKVMENPESVHLYDKVWRKLKKRVFFPVWAKNVIAGGPARSYRSLGYTSGAKEWFQSGGTLMQEGVANIRFEIRDP